MTDESQSSIPVPSDPISQRAAWWFAMVRAVGWPTILLFVVGFAGYRFTVWFEPRASKVIDTHVETVGSLRVQSEKQTQILGEMSDSQKSQGDMLRDIHRAVVRPAQQAKNDN